MKVFGVSLRLFLVLIATSWMATPSLIGQDFLSVRHTVSSSFLGVDPFGDDPPFDTQTVRSTNFAAFNQNLDVGAGGVTAQSGLSSDVDPVSGIFYAYGFAAAGLYVQGSAFSDNSSDFRTVFTLDGPGRVELEGIIGVSEFLGTDFSFDEPGFARVVVRVRNLDTRTNVVRRVVRMNGRIGDGQTIEEFAFEGEDAVIELPEAGRYQLLVNARADDMEDGERQGSLAVSFFELEGQIRQE